MADGNPLAGKTPEDIRQLGMTICSSREWRWCALWVCALHREFRPYFQQRHYWSVWDDLLGREIDWHRGRELFDSIRREALDSVNHESPEGTHYRIAEIGTKCMSNASWYPGLFDFHAPYSIPGLVIHLTRQLELENKERRMGYHFISLAFQSQPRPRDERGNQL
jgi:hypothetical protein